MPQSISSLVNRLVKIPNRLRNAVSWYLASLFIDAQKHTQSFAAELSGLHRSQFSRLLSEHQCLAIDSLKKLGIRIAGLNARIPLVKGAPWTVFLIIDATLHNRSSKHVQNSQKFNHGEGWVIGHQWTNIILVVGDRVIPLPPITFLSKNECKRRGIAYQTEHEKISDYLSKLDLKEYLGIFDPREILVLADSAYDDKKLENLILSFGWDFVLAIKTIRSVKLPSEVDRAKTKWRQVNALFRDVKKQAPWETVRIETAAGKRRRKFRTRLITAYLKGVKHPMAVVCSEKYTGKGKRRFFACSNNEVSVATILKAYRCRWSIEIFHRTTKSFLGFEHAGVVQFDSLVSHVHWVYCAYLLLNEQTKKGDPPMHEKQRRIRELFHAHELKTIRQLNTRIDGKKEVKRHCERALQELVTT